MALLFDENVPASLIRRLAGLWPDCRHVVRLGLESSSDTIVWEYAKEHDLTIVTKDRDFHARSGVFGPPPQVVWLRLGNCPVAVIDSVLRRHADAIDALRADPSVAILIIDR